MKPVHEHEKSFDVFGSRVRLLIGDSVAPELLPPEVAALEIEALMRGLHAKLTRFEPGSELCELNSDPTTHRTVSPELAMAVRAGIWAAEETDGLVDPTLVDEIEGVGYARSRAGVAGAPIAEAIRAAPRRCPARPRPGSRWREVKVDVATSVVSRPPGVRIDTGGTGKGLAADLAAGRLAGYDLFAVDVGGDLRTGGARPRPRIVEIDHPLEGASPAFKLVRGAVATSGLRTRVWRTADGYAHHLLDPSTGRPAWTGVIQATAVAGTALRAETLAKEALLSGAERGRELLSQDGGVLVLDDGSVEVIGPLAARIREPARAEAA